MRSRRAVTILWKSALPAAILWVSGMEMRFMPPTRAQQLAAIGPTSELPEALRRALEPGQDFLPVPPLLAGIRKRSFLGSWPALRRPATSSAPKARSSINRQSSRSWGIMRECPGVVVRPNPSFDFGDVDTPAARRSSRYAPVVTGANVIAVRVAARSFGGRNSAQPTGVISKANVGVKRTPIVNGGTESAGAIVA